MSSSWAFAKPLLSKPATFDFAPLFKEEILTITKEVDNFSSGTLRTTLIKASGIRSQDPFSLVKIVFASNVKRIQISQGPLPELDGGLTTLDCSIASHLGRGVIEWKGKIEAQADDQEGMGLILSSSGNTIKNCHFIGFPKSALTIISGNQNQIKRNSFGFHPEVEEVALPRSIALGEPGEKQKMGIILKSGLKNEIQANDFVNNDQAIELASQEGAVANLVALNYFTKNKQNIRTKAGRNRMQVPIIQKVQKNENQYRVTLKTITGATVQLYLFDKQDQTISQLLEESKSLRSKLELYVPDKGFVPGETEFVALAFHPNKNTSQFSRPFQIPNPNPSPSTPPTREVSKQEESKRPVIQFRRSRPREEKKQESAGEETFIDLSNIGRGSRDEENDR